MFGNRTGELRGQPTARFANSPRRVALMAIEEVLSDASSRKSVHDPPATRTAVLPTAVPPAVAPPVARPRRRRRHRRRRGSLVAALTLGLALCIGALLGSGTFNAQDRYNAELVAAQQGDAEVYVLPEVQGHPGAAPTRERSGSIREFLGMASAF